MKKNNQIRYYDSIGTLGLIGIVIFFISLLLTVNNTPFFENLHWVLQWIVLFMIGCAILFWISMVFISSSKYLEKNKFSNHLWTVGIFLIPVLSYIYYLIKYRPSLKIK